MKAHKKNDGSWGPCRAGKRPCPKGGERDHREFSSMKQLREVNDALLQTTHQTVPTLRRGGKSVAGGPSSRGGGQEAKAPKRRLPKVDPARKGVFVQDMEWALERHFDEHTSQEVERYALEAEAYGLSSLAESIRSHVDPLKEAEWEQETGRY